MRQLGAGDIVPEHLHRYVGWNKRHHYVAEQILDWFRLQFPRDRELIRQLAVIHVAEGLKDHQRHNLYRADELAATPRGILAALPNTTQTKTSQERLLAMRLNDMFPSRYLKAADIGDGERVLTISGVIFEEVGEDREKKPVLQFSDEKKGLVLNKTNADRIAYVAGTDESNEWVGLKVTLVTEFVSFAGKSAPAIRVRNTRPLKPANMPAASPIAAVMAKAEDSIPSWVTDPQDPGAA
jgi:hypothetical protein